MGEIGVGQRTHRHASGKRIEDFLDALEFAHNQPVPGRDQLRVPEAALDQLGQKGKVLFRRNLSPLEAVKDVGVAQALNDRRVKLQSDSSKSAPPTDLKTHAPKVEENRFDHAGHTRYSTLIPKGSVKSSGRNCAAASPTLFNKWSATMGTAERLGILRSPTFQL